MPTWRMLSRVQLRRMCPRKLQQTHAPYYTQIIPPHIKKQQYFIKYIDILYFIQNKPFINL